MPFGQKISAAPLESFDPDTRRMLLCLPKQVGRWMADVDEGGGPLTHAAETAAIPNFLSRAAHKFESLPFLSTLARAALTEPYTPLRESALFSRIKDVFQRIHPHTTELDRNAFKLLLIEMAEAVARAAPDGDPAPRNLMKGAEQGWYGLYPALMNNLMRHSRGPRVSTIEKQAINRLIDHLDAELLVCKWD